MKDPKVVRTYQELQLEFAIIEKIIRARTSKAKISPIIRSKFAIIQPENQIMKEIMRSIILDENAAFHVICHDCPKVLYEPESDDSITRRVAQSFAEGHSGAFSNPHRISVVKGTGKEMIEVYRMASQEFYIQEGLPV